VIYEAVDPNANIIFGALIDPTMNGEVAITVIATGTVVILLLCCCSSFFTFDQTSEEFICQTFHLFQLLYCIKFCF